MSTKYPIILVHGIFAKDMLGGMIGGFGAIPRMLRRAGFSVYVCKSDGFGTVEANAAVLFEQIEDILAAEGAEKINIIAHSKGGIDSIYMIRQYGMESKIASLTTLCTPHRGTALADFICGLHPLPRKILTGTVNFLFKILGDKHPDSLAVLRQLSEKNPYFPSVLPFSEFYCQSYASEFRHAVGDLYLAPTLLILRRICPDTPSDGAVPVASAKYGVWRGLLVDASVSHRQMIDFIAIFGKKRKKVHAGYLGICQELAEMGL